MAGELAIDVRERRSADRVVKRALRVFLDETGSRPRSRVCHMAYGACGVRTSRAQAMHYRAGGESYWPTWHAIAVF